MCDTRYDPHTPLPVQLEQVLHNASTWRDAIDVMDAQLPRTQRYELVHQALATAAQSWEDARHDTLTALRAALAGDQATGTTPERRPN
jgi:hypothetical protein